MAQTEQKVAKGKTVSGVILYDSHLEVYGTAVATQVHNDCKVHVNSGGQVSSTFLHNGGKMHVSSGGTAYNTVLSAFVTGNSEIYTGANLKIYSGGTAYYTSACGKGYVDVKSGGTAYYTEISCIDGCIDPYTMTVSDQGKAYETILNSGTYMAADSGAYISGVSVMSGASATVGSGASADDIVVTEGGYLYIQSGGSANIILSDPALQTYVYAEDGSNVSYVTGSRNPISGWGTSSGSSASSSLSNEILQLNGDCGSVHIQSGCTAYLNSGAKASDIQIDRGGVMVVPDNAQEPEVTGTITVAGTLDASAGKIACNDDFKVVWDISSGEEPGTPMIVNMDHVASMDFRISISANQASGFYYLADGLVDLPDNYKFRIGVGDSFTGTISLDKKYSTSNADYLLALEGTDLYLRVKEKSGGSKEISAPSAPADVSADVRKYNVTVSWNKYTPEKGAKVSYEITCNGGETISSKSNKYTLKNAQVGNYVFNVRTIVTGKDGTVKESEWSSASADVADVTAPKIGKITSVRQDGPDTVSVEWTSATDNVGIDHYLVKANGQEQIVAGSENTAVFTGVAGKVNLEVYAYDTAGLSSKAAKKSYKMQDKTAPTAPTDIASLGINNKSGGTLAWTASTDNVGVAQYEIRITGVSKVYKSKTNSAKLSKLAVGTYECQVVAFDKARNDSETAYGSFIVNDVIAPKIKSLKGTLDAADASIKLNWNATDETTNPVSYQFSYDGMEKETIAMGTGVDVLQLSASEFTAGQHQIGLKVWDAAGNETTKVCKVNIKDSDLAVLA